MNSKKDDGLKKIILAFYKGKILLSSIDSLTQLRQKNVWSFPDIKKSFEFGKTTASFVIYDNIFSYIKLTEKNVFAINREDGKRLEFYHPSEFDSLLLSSDTKLLYLQYKEKITEILSAHN